MRPRIPSANSERSLTLTIEYGLTVVLVLVVVAAILQISGLHPNWLY